MKKIISDKRAAMDLAVFIKRVTYDDAYRRSDGETEEARKEMAYRILSVLGDVQDYLAEQGFSPR